MSEFHPDRLLNQLIRPKDLGRYVGLKTTRIRELIRAGQFPKPIPLTDNGRAVAWLATEIRDWQEQRIAARAQYKQRR